MPSYRSALPLCLSLFCCLLVLGSGTTARAQSSYAKEILAGTGGSLVTIDPQVAINDQGWIAFTGNDNGGISRGWVAKDPQNFAAWTFGSVNRQFRGVDLTDGANALLVARDRVNGPVYYIRSWTEAGIPQIVGKSPDHFDSASFNVSANAQGVVALSALVNGSTTRAVMAGVAAPPASLHLTGGGSSFRTAISDGGEVIFRDDAGTIRGHSIASPGMQLEQLAGSSWSGVGAAPSISEDGEAIAFAAIPPPLFFGDSSEGVFVAVGPPGTRNLFRICGAVDGFTDIAEISRVAVTSQSSGSGPSFETTMILAWMGTRFENGVTTVGLWTREAVYSVATLGVTLGPLRLVAAIGESLGGGTIQSISVFHPLARTGVLGFRAVIDNGVGTVVVRASEGPTLVTERETMGNVRPSSSLTLANGQLQVNLEIDNDNGNGSLTNVAWRRWWYFGLTGLDPNTVYPLQLNLSGYGYGGRVLPVWRTSTDGGVSFGPWTRMPLATMNSANYPTPVQSPSGSGLYAHQISATLPPGVTDVEIAKWFPYTWSAMQDYLASLSNAAQPWVQVSSLPLRPGSSLVAEQNMAVVEISDPSTPPWGKRRIWVHSGAHPGEHTAPFTAEGLIEFLRSNDPEAVLLRRNFIFEIYPMINPGGVFVGNYRSNSDSQNIEEEWDQAIGAAASAPEVNLLKSRFNTAMSFSAANPGAPVSVALNLHSSHASRDDPFLFIHQENTQACSGTRVLPSVRAKELAWLQSLANESSWVNGNPSVHGSSTASSVFFEKWSHDHHSCTAAFQNAGREIMAITLEGTYRMNASGSWNTPADFRQLGADVGRAFYDLFSGGLSTSYPVSCPPLELEVAITQQSSTLAPLTLTLSGTPAASFLVASALGAEPTPAPAGVGCTLLIDPLLIPGSFLVGTLPASGLWSLTLPVTLPAQLSFDLQAAEIPTVPSAYVLSNAVRVLYLP